MSKQILRYKYVPVDNSFLDDARKPPDYKGGSLDIIKNGTMKFTHPKDFNDPFDCYPEIDAKNMSNDAWKNKVFRDNYAKEHKLSSAQLIQEKSKILKKLEMFFYQKTIEFKNKSFGICSLSRNPLNLLMWAHYASSHTGVVVEFSTPKEIVISKHYTDDDYINASVKCLAGLLPVQYELNKPIVNAINNFDEIRKHILTKGKEWEYEQEERVLDQIRGAGIHPYDRKRILKSVIAGMKMSDEHFTVLKNTVEQVNKELDMNITVHKAEPVKGKFALFVPDRPDLDFHNT